MLTEPYLSRSLVPENDAGDGRYFESGNGFFSGYGGGGTGEGIPALYPASEEATKFFVVASLLLEVRACAD